MLSEAKYSSTLAQSNERQVKNLYETGTNKLRQGPTFFFKMKY